ncbi:Methyltransferase type 12 [Cordyceps militaris]|uniref:Methyltransferase type 12 n=1 Tax=Cordyceps militaris TaxID=73501 RepID=A0A2H4SHA4_CORMI|nr:Methyltransferase type 12 [Cordyceps militaris]
MESVDWESLNRRAWDERAPLHAASPDYHVAKFLADPTYISPVVAFDAPLLGPLTNLRCAHLQCHIGTDTLSLARRGAASVTGLDFSGASLAEADKLAAATASSGGARLRFVRASVYHALDVLDGGAFDLVFTGIGALCWIPDCRRWAAVVAGLLRPGGGRLFMREGHPSLWALDDAERERLVVRYPYFERGRGPPAAVGRRRRDFENATTAEFNHGLGEIVQALLDEGLRVTGLTEHQSVPWDALPGQMEEIGGGEYALKSERWRLPLTYTLQAVKE